MSLRSVAPLAVMLAAAHPASAIDAKRPDVTTFVARMSEQHGLDKAWTRRLLEQAEHQEQIVEAISRPAEKTKPWYEYREIFITEKRIAGGVEFWRAHDTELEQAQRRFGVDPAMLVAILGVESFYGRIQGRYRVLDALATLAFDYPPRSAFFRDELAQFLLLAQEGQVDPLTALGSYAGAMGQPQFISSSYRRFSVDSDGDGRRDLWTDTADILGSIANYFREHGWESGQPTIVPARVAGAEAAALAVTEAKLTHTVDDLRRAGVEIDAPIPGDRRAMLLGLEGRDGTEYWVGLENFYAITRYNRSVLYALAVHQLGQEIATRVAGAEAAMNTDVPGVSP
jgi:membrane-bound lytic murein transglycosylase B